MNKAVIRFQEINDFLASKFIENLSKAAKSFDFIKDPKQVTLKDLETKNENERGEDSTATD